MQSPLPLGATLTKPQGTNCLFLRCDTLRLNSWQAAWNSMFNITNQPPDFSSATSGLVKIDLAPSVQSSAIVWSYFVIVNDFHQFNWSWRLPRLLVVAIGMKWQWHCMYTHFRTKRRTRHHRADAWVMVLQYLYTNCKNRKVLKCCTRPMITNKVMIWKCRDTWHMTRMALRNSRIGTWRHN